MEIGSGVVIGDRCRIQAMVYIPAGVMIGNDVFIGPRVTFLNDKYPPNKDFDGTVIVDDEGCIGGGALILPGVRLNWGCKIGAGAVVTRDVPSLITVVGVPAKEFSIDKPRSGRRV